MWLPDAAEVWKPAEVLRDYSPGDLTLSLQLEDGTVRQNPTIKFEQSHRVDCSTSKKLMMLEHLLAKPLNLHVMTDRSL